MTKISVTKLTLVILTLALVVFQGYILFKWWDINDLFSNVVIAVVSFYFWQKGIQYESTDSIVEEDKDKPVL